MDRIFIETEEASVYRVACIDKSRIFSAQDPGLLATVFECSLDSPTSEDCAEIFYALSPSIGGLDLFADFVENYRSHKLNHWDIMIKDNEVANLFLTVQPLNREDRLKLYAEKHDITPTDTVTSTSPSLMSLVAFSPNQRWKTGILQRCIDCLVFPKFRKDPKVYAVIDEEYRRLMRYKFETEFEGIPTMDHDRIFGHIRHLMFKLSLGDSRDPTPFSSIPDDIDLDPIIKGFSLNLEGSLTDKLSEILFKWCGSRVIECENGYQLVIDPNVTEGLAYMQPLLRCPEVLSILETPM